MSHSNDTFRKSINPVSWAFWSHLSSKFNKVIIRTKNIPETSVKVSENGEFHTDFKTIEKKNCKINIIKNYVFSIVTPYPEIVWAVTFQGVYFYISIKFCFFQTLLDIVQNYLFWFYQHSIPTWKLNAT